MVGFRASLILVVALAPVIASAELPLRPLDIHKVKVAGPLGHRIDLTVAKNILAIDHEKSFLKYFRERSRPPFSYVGLGKEIDALVRLAYSTNEPRLLKLKDKIVRETIQTQLEDGYIGIFADDRLRQWWDLHELSYIIYALVQDYRYFDNQEALAAARRAGDFILQHRKARLMVHHVSTIGLERGLLALHAATGDARYLDYVNLKGSLAHWQADVGGHAYDYLNLFLAQLDLYEQSGDRRLLRQAHSVLEYLTAKNGLLVDGTCSYREGWHTDQTGTGDTGETCATSYLIRFWDKMLQIEGKSLYGDLMERAIYNALFAAQSPQGRELRKYTALEGPRLYYQGELGSDFQRDTYCCPNNFRRSIADLPGLIYYRAADAVAVNLYCASQASVRIGKNLTVELVQETDYPNSGNVRLRVNPSKPAEFELMLRIPRWCAGATVRINGQPGDCSATPGEFCTLRRSWKSGDIVELQMPMPLRLVRGRATQAGKVAVLRGPLLFCFNPTLNAGQEPALAGQQGIRGRKRGELVAQFNSVEAQLLVPEGLPTSTTGGPTQPGPERQALLARRNRLEKEIAGYRKVEDVLREVTFDLNSLTGPIDDTTVRPEGLALRIKAWGPGADRTAEPNLNLRLTEFADPGGEMTYFSSDKPQLEIEDELWRKGGT